MTNGKFSQTLTADDFEKFGDWLAQFEQTLKHYRQTNPNLSDDDKNLIIDHEQKINLMSQQMYTVPVDLVINEAQASLEKIQRATQDAQAAVQTKEAIDKVIAIAAAVIKIGASVMSRDVGGLVAAIGQVNEAIDSRKRMNNLGQNEKGVKAMSDAEVKSNVSWIIVGLIIAIIPVGLWVRPAIGLGWTWGIIATLMLVTIGIIGLSLGKWWTGVFIDPKTNTMSLSRLQVMLWTWVILSAFITIALARISDSFTNPQSYICQPQKPNTKVTCAGPVDIQLPSLLWALMGISITSAVASPLFKTAKVQKTAGQEEANQQRASRGGPPAETYSNVLATRTSTDTNLKNQVGETKPLGAVVRKDSWQKAAFSDMFTGEEVTTFGYIDIAKVQNFFFTLIAVVVYTVALVAAMLNTETIAQLVAFPDIAAGLVTIIGISHAGYLVDKAGIKSTPEGP